MEEKKSNDVSSLSDWIVAWVEEGGSHQELQNTVQWFHPWMKFSVFNNCPNESGLKRDSLKEGADSESPTEVDTIYDRPGYGEISDCGSG